MTVINPADHYEMLGAVKAALELDGPVYIRLGRLAVESVNNNDYSMILGMTVFYGIFLVTANLIVDILYGVADPRVRIGKK